MPAIASNEGRPDDDDMIASMMALAEDLALELQTHYPASAFGGLEEPIARLKKVRDVLTTRNRHTPNIVLLAIETFEGATADATEPVGPATAVN